MFSDLCRLAEIQFSADDYEDFDETNLAGVKGSFLFENIQSKKDPTKSYITLTAASKVGTDPLNPNATAEESEKKPAANSAAAQVAEKKEEQPVNEEVSDETAEQEPKKKA